MSYTGYDTVLEDRCLPNDITLSPNLINISNLLFGKSLSETSIPVPFITKK